MYKDKKIIAIIPARGGSKGLPRKNIKIINGKPLIYWSIKAAQESEYIDEVIVSTEDKEIGQVAKKFGATVLWRPKKLATDNATTLALLQYLTNELSTDVVVLLQPTSPIRVENLIDRAIKRFFVSRADSLATGYICRDYEWGTVENIPRQKLKGWFYDDGNVYVHKVEHLRQGKWCGTKKEKMIVDKYYNIEIDDQIDFLIVETLMKSFKKVL